MEDRIIDIIVDQQEITWKSIIVDLVRQDDMDPWNVDISKLSKMFLDRLRTYKDMDLKVSGKVLLAAAILLKMKSQRLVGDDLGELDRLIAQTEMDEDQFYDDLEVEFRSVDRIPPEQVARLIPRTPQPRKRKVSVFDLVKALEKALEVKHRRLVKKGMSEYKVFIPKDPRDNLLAMKHLHKRISEHYLLTSKSLMFSHLTKNQDRLGVIYSFIPLLQLTNQRVVDIDQKQAFDDFSIRLLKGKSSDIVQKTAE